MPLLRNVAVLALAYSLSLTGPRAAEPTRMLPLWSNATAPGDPVPNPYGAESDLTKPTENLIAGRRVIRLGNVTQPTLSIFRPAPGTAAAVRDAAVMVFPGGGYHILAWDLEGTEVCDWLNSQGITAGLLKYRVPKRQGMPDHAAALADAQQALMLMRTHAAEWGFDAHRIGALGFSAGGHLCAALAAAGTNAATRPDFNILIYPGGLVEKGNEGKLTSAVTVTPETPPTFLVMAQDDGVRVENPIHYYLALHAAKVPAELHLYPKGGHGYGLRRTSDNVTTWPDRTIEWLQRTLE